MSSTIRTHEQQREAYVASMQRERQAALDSAPRFRRPVAVAIASVVLLGGPVIWLEHEHALPPALTIKLGNSDR